MNINELLKTFLPEHKHFQPQLYEFVRKVKPDIMVETGVQGGVSTAFILKAMDENGFGHLYSIDPATTLNLKHKRWTLIKELSLKAMPKLYKATGPWDFFFHDSDHDAENQTFEYELAYNCVRAGGWIGSDDPYWGEPAHRSWEQFIGRHGLEQVILGWAVAAQKTAATMPVPPGNVDDAARSALAMGHAAANSRNESIRYQL